MHNICSSGNGKDSTASATDRLEVSTQALMSCSSFLDKGALGCEGGHIFGAATALDAKGIAKERDFPYRCGKGDPEGHFEGKSACTAAPWGISCDQYPGPNSAWTWDNYNGAAGAQVMQNYLSMGASLYV